MMERKKHVLKRIDIKKGRGLELGPLYSPVVSKEEADIYYVDHMSADHLRKKYKGHPFDVTQIVDVDYVVGGKTLKEVTLGDKFDYVIASHVIEHIPDVVSWLQDVSSVLKEGGILSLVIPDKRYSFDISRQTSRPSEVLGAYLDKKSKSTSAMIYDYTSEFREITPMDAWAGNISSSLLPPADNLLIKAWNDSVTNLNPETYVDAHCYTFTPSSFFQILRRLMFHDLVDFDVVNFQDTAQNELEFYVSLRKTTRTKASIRTTIPVVPDDPSIYELQKKIDKLEGELHRMLISNSWKITKPLREVESLRKRSFRKIRE